MPWNGTNFTVFYLPCVQGGEFFREDSIKDWITNHDLSKKDKSPYMKLLKIVPDIAPKPIIARVEIDHLLRDNEYLVELPEFLHKAKTKALDPFLPYQSVVDRSVLKSRTYWLQRFQSQNMGTCLCGKAFEKIKDDKDDKDDEDDEDDEDDNPHIHSDSFLKNWGARFMPP